MENIYRLKKQRMVYPEKLTLDQVDHKPSSARTSWCSGPLDVDYGSVRRAAKSAGEDTVVSFNQPHSPMLGNRQFIQDRIRHLVEAFSTRAQAARERIDAPATPSSVSSRETVEPLPPSATPRPQVRHQVESVERQATASPQPTEPELPPTLLKRIKNVLDTTVIDPNGKFYIAWMSIAALAVMFNAWVIPFRSTFQYQTPENRAIWMTFDYLADVVYLIDMFLIQTRVKYLNEGFWVTDMHLLRQNYMRKRDFKLDLISMIPLDLIYIFVGPDYVILRFPRIFKLHTFLQFFSFVDKLLANPHVIRITRTLMYMMYLIHLNACAYFAFSNWEGIGSNNFVYNGKGNAYIKCFYFATKTATSIGKNPKPTQNQEYMFMTFSWLMGVFVFALLIGQIRDIISTATRSETEYRKLVDETLEYMRRLNLPQEMQKRVQMWFSYTWEHQHTLDENTIMDCLPHKMKTDIAINVHIQILSKVKLFADCDEALLRELVIQLKSVVYLPGDIVCKKGDVGKEMYIVQTGKVQVIGRREDEVLATLSEGSVFGEISLLGIPGMSRRTADVRSQGYSNLFVLSKADLNAALSSYPEAQDLLNKKAKVLMKKNAALEKSDEAMIIIDNPTPPPKQAKLLETVLQVMPVDSKTNRLLRYGSKGRPRGRPENDIFKYRNSLPTIKTTQDSGNSNLDSSFETKVTVHRTLS